ncbi:MAG: hypothetical protein M0008_12510 [Actinomycetota bacterium]|nr:hypothetical protein [Actinomycetota bacterium]
MRWTALGNRSTHERAAIALPVRLERALIAGGYLIVAIGAAISVLETYTLYVAIGGTHLIQLAILANAAIIAWAWWSIVPVLQSADGRRQLRRPLRVFACANVVLSLGWIGNIVQECDSMLSLRQSAPLIGNWIVMIAGLCVAAIGFIKISNGTNTPQNDAMSAPERSALIEEIVSRKTQRPAFQVTRTLILTGYAFVAVGVGIVGWVAQLGDGAVGLYYDAAAVVSSGLIAWAWWSCIAGLAVSRITRERLRVSFRHFAIASGVMVVALFPQVA